MRRRGEGLTHDEIEYIGSITAEKIKRTWQSRDEIEPSLNQN